MATSREIKERKEKSKKIKTIRTKVCAHDTSKPEVKGKGIYWEKIEPNLDMIGAWIRDGLSMEQIAKNLDVSKFTLKKYAERYEDLHTMIQMSRQRIDYVHMINAYQRRAEGYTVIEREEEYKVHSDGTEELVKVKKRERHVPADPRALENWIQLRMRDDPLWGQLRDVLHDNDLSVSGEGGIVFIPAKKVIDGEGKDMGTATETDGVHEPT